jgi:hypothetical protein
MIYLRIGAGQTLVAHTRRSIPWRLRANPERQLWGVGKERVGDPQSKQTSISFWIALDDGVSMMWSDHDLNGSLQHSDSASLPSSLNPM